MGVLLQVAGLLRVCLALVLAAVLVAGGMARAAMDRPASGADAAALALFLAMGGSPADLCHDADDGGHGRAHRGECPACVLPAAILPPRAPSVALPLACASAGLAPRIHAQTTAPPRAAPLPPPTGPPVSSLS